MKKTFLFTLLLMTLTFAPESFARLGNGDNGCAVAEGNANFNLNPSEADSCGSSASGKTFISPLGSGYGSNAYVTSGYGRRVPPTRGASTNHCGVDIGAGGASARGTPIYAMADGCVTRHGDSGNGYGNIVTIDYGDGIVVQAAHLDQVTVASVMDSDGCVRQGQQIGTMGSSGVGSGVHLDLSLVNPQTNLAGSRNGCTNPQSVFSCLSAPEMRNQITRNQNFCQNTDVTEPACDESNSGSLHCQREQAVDCDANPEDPSCGSSNEPEGPDCSIDPTQEGCENYCENNPDAEACGPVCEPDENGNYPAECNGEQVCTTDPETGVETCSEVACWESADGDRSFCGVANEYTPIGASLGQTMNFDDCLKFKTPKPCIVAPVGTCPGLPPYVGPIPGLKFQYNEPTAIVETVCRPGKSYFMGDAPLANMLGGSLDNEATNIRQCVTSRTQEQTTSRRNANFFEAHVWGISPLARYASSGSTSGSTLDVTLSLTCGYIGKAMAMASGSQNFFKNFNLSSLNPGEMFQNMTQNIGQAVQGFGQSLAQLPQTALQSIQDIGTGIGEMAANAGDFVGSAMEGIQNFPGQVGDFMSNLPTNIGNGIDGLGQGITEGFNGVMDGFTGTFEEVGNMVQTMGGMTQMFGSACSLTGDGSVCAAAEYGAQASSIGGMMQGIDWSNMSPGSFRETMNNLGQMDMEQLASTFQQVGTFAATAEASGIDLGGAGEYLVAAGAGMGVISNVDWQGFTGAASEVAGAPGSEEYFTGEGEAIGTPETMAAGISTGGDEVAAQTAVRQAQQRNDNIYSVGSAALQVGAIAAGVLDNRQGSSTSVVEAAQTIDRRNDPSWLCDAHQSLGESQQQLAATSQNIASGTFDEVIPEGSYTGSVNSRSSTSCAREGAVGVISRPAPDTLKGFEEEVVGCSEQCSNGVCQWVPHYAGVDPADCTKPISDFTLGAPAINDQSARIDKIAYAVRQMDNINANAALSSAEKLNESQRVLNEAGITQEEVNAFRNHPQVENPYSFNVDGVQPACDVERMAANQQISNSMRNTTANTIENVEMSSLAVEYRMQEVQAQYGCEGSNCGCSNGRPTGQWANSSNRQSSSSGGLGVDAGTLAAGAGALNYINQQGGISGAANNAAGQVSQGWGDVRSFFGNVFGPQGTPGQPNVMIDESGAFGGINNGSTGGDVNTGGVTNPFNPNPLSGEPVNENTGGAPDGNPQDVSHGGVTHDSGAVGIDDNGNIVTRNGDVYSYDPDTGVMQDAEGNVIMECSNTSCVDAEGNPIEGGGSDPGGTFESLKNGLETLDALTRDGGVKNAIAGLVGSQLPWGLWVAYFSEIDKESWYKADEGVMSIVQEMIGQFKVTVGATAASALEIGEVAGIDSSALQQKLYGLLGLVGSWGTLEPKTGWCFAHNPYICSAIAGYRGHHLAAALGSLPTDKSGKGMQLFNMDFPPKDGRIDGSYKPTKCYEAGDIDFNAEGFGGLNALVGAATGGGLAAFGEGSPETTLQKDEGYVYTYWKRTSCCIALNPSCKPNIKQYY